jgi:hypothetical protein
MKFNLLNILTKRIRPSSYISFTLMITYICFSLFLFFQWVNPSLVGHTDLHIAADSTTYLYFADSLREGRQDPLVIAALYSFPNTLWCPVLLALALKSTFAIVLANYAIFFLALILLKKSFCFSAWGFMGLLALNATTTISLLSVNKEIIDLLVISIFFFARHRHHNGMYLLAFLLALFNRFEIFLVMFLFLFLESKFNPWHRKRFLTLVMLVVCLSVALPLVASGALNARFEEAKEGHVVAMLDFLEIHYLYILAVIPKIAENLFAEIVNIQKLQAYLDFSDIANTYIVFFNNLATAIVFAVLIRKRLFKIGTDSIYFAAIGWIIMAISLVIQPRYFYFAYVLLCLQAAQTGSDKSETDMPHQKRDCKDCDASLLNHKEATLG